jgi:ABC-type transport system involved in multi-copper enzyme maturation permease subunit
MSTTTVTAELPRTHSRSPRRPRLVNAEVLKLRKRSGLVLATFALTILPMIVAYIVLGILHATEPAKHGPAGGLENFSGSMYLLTQLGVVAAILVGATAGAGDLRSGVFRELVVTGRPRLDLFAARVPAGLGLAVAAVWAGFAVTAVASTVLAGSLEAPSAGLLVESAAWLAIVVGLALVLALSVSSAVGSRGTTIGVLVGWQIVLMPFLLQLKPLGSLRELLPVAATERVAPSALFDGGVTVPMSLSVAIAVIAAWTILSLAVGAWRTSTRDA